MASKCKREKEICPKCAGDHRSNRCESDEEICINCKYASETLKIPNIDYNHTAFNRNCEAYKRIYGQIQQKVNYPEIYRSKSE